MPLHVEPIATDEELAAIVATLEASFEPEEVAPVSRSRWRAAGRVYDGETAAPR